MKYLLLILIFPLQTIFSQDEFEFTRTPINEVTEGLTILECEKTTDYITNKNCSIKILENKVLEGLNSGYLKQKYSGYTISFNYSISIEGKTKLIKPVIKKKNKIITDTTIIEEFSKEITKNLALVPLFIPAKKEGIFYDAIGNIPTIQL